MEITLVGYGKMGKEVERLALQNGYKINAICANTNELRTVGSGGGVCIDFTTPGAFEENYKILADKFSAVIVGTTGWQDIEAKVFDYFNFEQKTLIYASNFSLGVNIFFKLIDDAAKLLAQFAYEPYILEMHHKQKKDAPSGTAKTMLQLLQPYFAENISSASVRCGAIHGRHEIGFESEVDEIVIKHEAYSRQGFARGALLAAEWSQNVTGVWDFRDLIDRNFKK